MINYCKNSLAEYDVAMREKWGICIICVIGQIRFITVVHVNALATTAKMAKIIMDWDG